MSAGNCLVPLRFAARRWPIKTVSERPAGL